MQLCGGTFLIHSDRILQLWTTSVPATIPTSLLAACSGMTNEGPCPLGVARAIYCRERTRRRPEHRTGISTLLTAVLIMQPAVSIRFPSRVGQTECLVYFWKLIRAKRRALERRHYVPRNSEDLANWYDFNDAVRTVRHLVLPTFGHLVSASFTSTSSVSLTL